MATPMLTFEPQHLPASPHQIAAFEERHALQLPAEYKQFLLTTNGGCPAPNTFSIVDLGDALVDLLYGIRDDRVPGDLEQEQKEETLSAQLPPGFITIGHDPGGNMILLSTLGNAGRVYYYDCMGFWVRGDGPNTFPVADSFSAFLEALHE